MAPTDLYDGHQVRHIFKVIGREINITPCLDLLQGLVDLGTEFILAFTVFRHFPERKGQL